MSKIWQRSLVLFLILFFLLSFPLSGQAGAADVKEWPLLNEIKGLVEKYYAGEVDPKALEQGAIRGLLSSLGDPFTEYIPPEDVSLFNSAVDDEFGGVGIELRVAEEGKIVVFSTLPNTPAARVGIKPGDILYMVGLQKVQGLSLDKVVSLIRGEPGTPVILTFIRPGQEEPDIYVLTRETIRPPVLESKILENKIGYLALRSFPYWAPLEVKRALADLNEQGAKSIILDLRGNPGGYLNSALAISSLFLPKGTPIVQILDKDGKKETIYSVGPGQDLPVVALVDRNSASAAEILAGALQDAGLAKLVGERTFGKASVQSVVRLSNGGALKITTAHYLTPSGRQISGQGLKPDYELPGADAQLKKAIELLAAQEL
ncbi:MAG: carboxyl-terminal processing protease [Clostridia bacterium]|nr:carboxyl-terminal processing protease [Clostridia bacterium]